MQESRVIREQRQRQAEREADEFADAFTELLLAALELPEVRAAIRAITTPAKPQKSARGRR